MLAAKCARFYLNVFVLNNLHLSHDLNGSDKSVHKRISLDKKLKDQSEELHSPFLHHKSTKWKIYGF